MPLKGVDPLTLPSTSKKRVAKDDLKPLAKKHTIQDAYNIPIRNKYDSLSDEEMQTTDDENDNNVQPRRIKKIKIPPIIAYTYFDNHLKTISELEKNLNEEIELKFKGKRIIILTKNLIDYKYVKNQLDESNIQYTTKTPQSEREVKLVIRHLPPNISSTEVEEDLKSKKLPVLKVIQLSKKENDKIVHLYPLYMVTFEKGTDISTIMQNKKVCFCVIQWEKVRGNGVTQCFRCQAYGHISQNCTRTPRCVKCGQTHDTRACSKSLEVTPTCANCGDNHTANFRQCPKRPEARVNRPTPYTRPPRLSNASFPPLNKSSTPERTNPPTWPTINNTNTSSQSGLTEIMTFIKSIIQNFNLNGIIQNIKTLISRLYAAPDAASRLMIIIDYAVSLLG